MEAKTNMKYYLTICDPWDFENPDGKNIIKGTLNIKSDDFVIFEANYEIESDNVKSKFLILHPRSRNESFLKYKKKSNMSINGGLISEKDYKSYSVEKRKI